MSKFDEKMKRAVEEIKAYCRDQSISAKDCDDVITGVTRKYRSQDDLALAGVGDLQALGLPEPLAREIIYVWRGRDRESSKVVVATSPDAEAAQLSIEELLAKYDPDLQPDAYGKRLGDIARAYTKNTVQAPKVLIFDDDGTVNTDLTKKEFDRLKGVGTDRDIAIYGGISYETFPVGGSPPEYADQSPWNPAELLFKGVSNAGVEWGNLPLETKQVVYIVTFKTPAYQYPQHDKDLRTLATYRESELYKELFDAAPNSFQKAVEIFPYAGAFFRDLKRQGDLPSMKTPVGGDSKPTTPTPAAGGS